MWRGVVREYWDYLPVRREDCIITLLEGNTPLIPSSRIAKEVISGIDLYFKYEGLNPTGSFKDRGMTVAVSMAKEMASKAVICASTGNTSASAAAYAAKAGMKAYVLIPEGKIALGKLSQAMAHGAQVIQIEGHFDEALHRIARAAVAGKVCRRNRRIRALEWIVASKQQLRKTANLRRLIAERVCRLNRL